MKKFKISLFLLLGLILFGLAGIVQAQEWKVGTIERPPMSFKDDNGQWTGYSIDLLDRLAKASHATYQVIPFTDFSRMLDAVKQGKVDFSIANITINSSRERVMDFSQPIFDSGLQVIVPRKHDTASIISAVIKSGVLWFLLGAFVLLLVIAHIVWFFERDTPVDRHDYFRDDYLGGVWDAFWWAFIIMTMGGFENEVPASKKSRAIAMLWIIASLFFVSMLTAQITSALTVQGLSSGINSYKDLSGKRVGVLATDSVIQFMKDKVGVTPKIYKDYAALYSDLMAKKLDAAVGDAPILNYYVSHKAKDKLEAVGSIFKPEKYGIAFPQGSQLREKVDQILLQLQEQGVYHELNQKYFQK